MPVVMSIDMSDPTAGTGINAATKTVHALGGYACAVVTAVSVQTPDAVTRIDAVSPQTVREQIQAIHDSFPINAILLGMLPNKDVIDIVGDYLDAHHSEDVFVLVDPVMINQVGYQFLAKEDIDALKRRLLIHADIITPNVYETEQLTGVTLDSRENAEHAAEMLMTLGCRSVLIKGETMTEHTIQDLYLDDDRFYIVETPRLNSKKIHGAGATLAAAITVSVALGMPVTQAISGARSYLAQAIQYAPDLTSEGRYGPLEHFI